jgi:CDP-diacylglycerol--glycerol-3-phosphate 3-phosphatidyltransferase
MGPMISRVLKPVATRAITPTAKLMLRCGFTPNGVTIVGAIGVVIAAFALYPSGHFFIGSLVITVFILSDLFDGTMARISKLGSSPWGGFLDSTIDRIADSSVLIALILYLHKYSDPLLPIVLIALVTGILVSYVRAKAESLGIECNGGFAERTERLIVALVAIGLHGLHLQFALAVGMWVLAIMGIVTIGQRILIVRNSTHR